MVANWLQQPQLSHLHTIVYKMGESKEYKRDNYWDVFLVWEGEKTPFPKPSTFSNLIMII